MAMNQTSRNQTEMMANQNRMLAQRDAEQRRERKIKNKAKQAALLEKEKALREEDRKNEPMISWVYRTFRVITIGAALVLGGMEAYKGMAAQAENVWEHVLFVAWSAWMAFGLVWAGAAVIYWFSLRKSGEGKSRAARQCLVNIAVAVVGMVILGVLAML